MTKKCNKCLLPGVFRKHSRICNNCKNKQSSQYKKNNKEKISIYNKSYKKNNSKEISTYNKNYRNNNKDIIKKYKNIYESQKRLSDPSYKLRQNLSNHINYVLKTNGGNKGKHSILEYLPYTIDELRAHLESQFEPWMTWQNRGIFNSNSWNDDDKSTWTWQIDHIVPQSKFPHTSMEDENFNKCWALSNLRPFSAKQNSIDGGTRVRH